MEDVNSIHAFWFGLDADDAVTAKQNGKLWWSKDAALDQTILTRFESTLEAAAQGRLDDWTKTPLGLLALILLSDQFTRNMYRAKARAFDFDRLARLWSLSGLDRGLDQKLRPIERVFFYLPLEHSESIADQEHSVQLFTQLLESVAAEQAELFRGFLNFAVKHRDIIARFGRFPHRNDILGRASTPEEIIFLQQPGSSF